MKARGSMKQEHKATEYTTQRLEHFNLKINGKNQASSFNLLCLPNIAYKFIQVFLTCTSEHIVIHM